MAFRSALYEIATLGNSAPRGSHMRGRKGHTAKGPGRGLAPLQLYCIYTVCVCVREKVRFLSSLGMYSILIHVSPLVGICITSRVYHLLIHVSACITTCIILFLCIIDVSSVCGLDTCITVCITVPHVHVMLIHVYHLLHMCDRTCANFGRVR